MQLSETGADGKVKGGDCGGFDKGGKAYVFYFTHPGRIAINRPVDEAATRRSSIQVTELIYKNGVITCDRDAPCYINLSGAKEE